MLKYNQGVTMIPIQPRPLSPGEEADNKRRRKKFKGKSVISRGFPKRRLQTLA